MAKLFTVDEMLGAEIQPRNGKNFKLEELYELLDCSTIQTCDSCKPGHILIFDEEFLCKHDPVLNRTATHLMHAKMGPFKYNVICGKAILCKSSELE